MHKAHYKLLRLTGQRYILNLVFIQIFMRLIFSALLVIFVVTPITGNANSTCPERITNRHECSLYLESLVIKSNQNTFVRKGNVLQVKLLKGNIVNFKDILGDNNQHNDEDVTRYALVKYFSEINYALIAVSLWEGGTSYLLNMNTGAKFLIGAEDAALSPDKLRIVVWSMDISANYYANFLAIYLISPKRLVREYIVEPNDWRPTDVWWQNSKSLRFTKNYWIENAIHQDKEQSIHFKVDSMNPTGRWKLNQSTSNIKH